MTIPNTAKLEDLALNIAMTFDQDDNAKAFVEDTLQAFTTAKRGPVAFLYHVIIPLFGVEMIREQWPDWIKKTDAQGNDLPNPAEIKLASTTKDGSPRTITTDFYSLIADDTAEGKIDKHIIDECAKALSKDAAIAASAVEPYRSWVEDALRSELAYREARRTNRRRLWRNAARVFKKFDEINNKLPDVECEFELMPKIDEKGQIVKGADGNPEMTLTNSPHAVFCHDKKSKKRQPFASVQFVELDCDKALAKGGSLLNLLDTTKKGTNKATGAKTKVLSAEIKDTTAYVTISGSMAAFEEGDTKRVGLVVTELLKDDHALLSYYRHAAFVDLVYRQIEARGMQLEGLANAAIIAEKNAKDRLTQAA